MAAGAAVARIVRAGIDLREGLGLGNICPVTEKTKISPRWFAWFYGNRIFGMLQESAVTGLAIDGLVLRFRPG